MNIFVGFSFRIYTNKFLFVFKIYLHDECCLNCSFNEWHNVLFLYFLLIILFNNNFKLFCLIVFFSLFFVLDFYERTFFLYKVCTCMYELINLLESMVMSKLFRCRMKFGHYINSVVTSYRQRHEKTVLLKS